MGSKRIRYFLGSLVVAYVVIGIFAMIQFIFVFEEFSPRFLIVPIIVSTVTGLGMGSILWLRAQLQEQKRLFQGVADFASEFTYIQGPSGKYLYVSPASKDVTGYAPEAFHHNPGLMLSLIDQEDRTRWLDHDHPLNEDGRPRPLDIRIHRADGELRTLRHVCDSMYDSDGGFIGIRSTNIDVTHSLRAEQRIHDLAEYDPLTELGNRRRLEKILRQSVRSCEKEQCELGILYIDLNRFKYINDVYGHSVGDVLLRALSRRLSSNLDEGVELFRFGGDEFVLLASRIESETDLETCALTVQSLMLMPVAVADMEFNLGASIGIARYPRDGHDPDTLIKHADLAMYEAKRGHEQFHFFESELADIAADVIQYESMLRESLDRDELVAYFQPIIDLTTGEICSAEALARWIHREHGMIGPDRFIAMAEDTGLILPLGNKILEQSLREARYCKDRGKKLRISINVSARQFQQQDFCDQVMRKITDVGVEPDSIMLEITESVLMENMSVVKDSLQEARRYGVRVALDDFGTGFSSLQYLADLPVDVLKLDRCMIGGLENNERRLRLVRSLVYMAHELGLSVVAEGIENEKQEKIMRDLGPIMGQGYFFSRPLPPEDFRQLLQERDRTSELANS
jgi:diguanylate cyclase (GGDEF)-like protein/PAS domain S-box-containing protein